MKWIDNKELIFDFKLFVIIKKYQISIDAIY